MPDTYQVTLLEIVPMHLSEKQQKLSESLIQGKACGKTLALTFKVLTVVMYVGVDHVAVDVHRVKHFQVGLVHAKTAHLRQDTQCYNCDTSIILILI